MSVSTSHALGPAKLTSDAGGTEPAKFNVRTDPFAIWTDPFEKRSYKPPLKNRLLGSFRLESQMYCSLAQGVVLNGMFFALGLYFSSPNGVIGPARPDIPGGLGPTWKELSPLDEHLALFPKNTLSWNVPFLAFL